MRAFLLVPLLALGVGSFSLDAQNVAGSGWSSFGVLPFRGYDFVIVKAPTQYILYYTQVTSAGEVGTNPSGRAFSADLKTWKVDVSDVCTTSGDLCHFTKSRTGVLTLPDGRLRLFVNSGGSSGSLYSMISSDGLVWTLEPGVRLAPLASGDPSSVYERGPFSLQLASFVRLDDGSVRMYYEGGVVPDSPGTPAYYNNNLALIGTRQILQPSGMILSALSKDNGLTWVREGVRINPLVHGPVNLQTYADGTVHTQIDASDLTAVSVTENGQTVYRIYAPALESTVSYVSTDGLHFTLEGQIPADRGDAKATVLPDGRVWLVTNQYPDGIDDTIVYGPQSFVLNSARASVPPPYTTSYRPAHVPNSFQSVAMGLTGASNGPVTFTAIDGPGQCLNTACPFQPQNYSFTPSSVNSPSATLVSDVGPSTYLSSRLIVHASSTDTTAVGAIFCMDQPLDSSDTSVFCKTATPNLPLNKMSFGFSRGSTASSQVLNILSLGGPGYPFTVSSSVPWATVSPANGIAPLPVTVKVDPAGLAAGSYTGTITISAEGTTEQITVSAVVEDGPVITLVVNAASGATGIASNSFITIYGSGFAISPTVWAPTTNLPTSLGGVQVKINGKDAFISYTGPGQINVLAPPDTLSGSVTVQVTTAAGTATTRVVLAPAAPGWFTYSAGTANWIAALFGNTATYVAPAGSFIGIASRSAKAGDILQLYANGLGATIPAAPPGVVLTTAYPAYQPPCSMRDWSGQVFIR